MKTLFWIWIRLMLAAAAAALGGRGALLLSLLDWIAGGWAWLSLE